MTRFVTRARTRCVPHQNPTKSSNARATGSFRGMPPFHNPVEPVLKPSKPAQTVQKRTNPPKPPETTRKRTNRPNNPKTDKVPPFRNGTVQHPNIRRTSGLRMDRSGPRGRGGLSRRRRRVPLRGTVRFWNGTSFRTARGAVAAAAIHAHESYACNDAHECDGSYDANDALACTADSQQMLCMRCAFRCAFACAGR